MRFPTVFESCHFFSKDSVSCRVVSSDLSSRNSWDFSRRILCRVVSCPVTFPRGIHATLLEGFCVVSCRRVSFDFSRGNMRCSKFDFRQRAYHNSRIWAFAAEIGAFLIRNPSRKVPEISREKWQDFESKKRLSQILSLFLEEIWDVANAISDSFWILSLFLKEFMGLFSKDSVSCRVVSSDLSSRNSCHFPAEKSETKKRLS